MENIYLGALALVILSLIPALVQLQNQVKKLQITTDAIAKTLGLEETLSADAQAEIDALLADGKRIKAIKAYRLATGEGLKEASDTIDQLIKKRTSQ